MNTYSAFLMNALQMKYQINLHPLREAFSDSWEKKSPATPSDR